MGLSFELVPYNQVLQQLVAPDSAMSCHSEFQVILLRLADWLRFREGEGNQPGSRPVSEEERRTLESSYEAWDQALHAYASRNQSQTLILFCPSSPEGSYVSEWQQLFDDYKGRLYNDLQSFPTIKCLDAFDFHQFYHVKQIYDPIGDAIS